MTIWKVELLHQTRASLIRLTRALDVDLPNQHAGESARSTLQNLHTAAALGVQDVILVSENGEAVAIATVRHDRNAHVGYARLLYVVPGVESAVADMLIQEVFDRIWSDPEMQNFDGQTFVSQPDIQAAFATRKLQPIARHEMVITDLTPFINHDASKLPDGFHAAPWWPNPGISPPDSHLNAVADLIIDAYRDTIDENLYPGLNTRTGLHQFFDEILNDRHNAFDHEASRIVYAGDGTDQMAGQVFCSRTTDRHLVILEIAVRHEYEGQGLARALLNNAIQVAAGQGLAGAQLQVSYDNPARHLYESLGFQATVPFWVYAAIRPETSGEGSEQSP